MKKGDLLPVTVQGVHITDAVVEEVESDRVHLLLPGTRAVVSVRMSLVDDAETSTPEKETIIDGVVRQDNSTDAPEADLATPDAPTNDTAEVETPADAPVEVETVG